MRTNRVLCVASGVSVFAVTAAYGLTLPFGDLQIAAAGTGCVAGYHTEHGTIAYFQGDTRLLNAQLASLAKQVRQDRSLRVLLHAGAHRIDQPDESLLAIDGRPDHIAVDWCVRRSCPWDAVRTGTCARDKQDLVVEIWLANEIRLEDLQVPERCTVVSAGEIDDFVRRHASRK